MSEPDDPYKPFILYDYNGNPVPAGVDDNDPNIIGPDTRVLPFSLRDIEKYPSYLAPLIPIEQTYVLPFAISIARYCEVDLIDEKTHNKIIAPVKQKFLFCVLSLKDVKIHEGVFSWDAFEIYARDKSIVQVHIRVKLDSKQAGIYSIKMWRRATQSYTLIANPPNTMSRETAFEVVTTYMEKEVFSYKSNLQSGEM